MTDDAFGEGRLPELLEQAREASPSTRIELRDPIAAYGESALDAMADWLGDPRLAAFAVRVLERIGRDPLARAAVVDVLRSIDAATLSEPVVRDIHASLVALGASMPRSDVATGRSRTVRGRLGREGTGYWVMRTSQWERPFIWREAQAGRLRQGWGSTPDQDLDVIARVRREGGRLNDDQEFSVRSRRMNTSEPDGMRIGDVIVAPNLPDWGRISVFRVSGSYSYTMIEPRRWGERFGHVLPVELLAGDIDKRSPQVPEGLRAMLRPQSRLFNISGYGGDVEWLLGNDVRRLERQSSRSGERWTAIDYELLFGRFPPSGPRPSDVEIVHLAAELGRTFDAVTWQWEDAAGYVKGGSASTTSEALMRWLDGRESI